MPAINLVALEWIGLFCGTFCRSRRRAACFDGGWKLRPGDIHPTGMCLPLQWVGWERG